MMQNHCFSEYTKLIPKTAVTLVKVLQLFPKTHNQTLITGFRTKNIMCFEVYIRKGGYLLFRWMERFLVVFVAFWVRRVRSPSYN